MANEKILVVDDDANICELLRLYLTKEGYQVTTAGDGEEGLEKFNQIKPDMVLLDVITPSVLSAAAEVVWQRRSTAFMRATTSLASKGLTM